jgi:hypothetical protein
MSSAPRIMILIEMSGSGADTAPPPAPPSSRTDDSFGRISRERMKGSRSAQMVDYCTRKAEERRTP